MIAFWLELRKKVKRDALQSPLKPKWARRRLSQMTRVRKFRLMLKRSKMPRTSEKRRQRGFSKQ